MTAEMWKALITNMPIAGAIIVVVVLFLRFFGERFDTLNVVLVAHMKEDEQRCKEALEIQQQMVAAVMRNSTALDRNSTVIGEVQGVLLAQQPRANGGA